MRLKTLVAVAVAAAFAAPLSTYAQSGKPSSGPSTGATAPSGGSGGFASMDKNKDGSLSREEAKGTQYEKDFAKLDKNNDGKLSVSEAGAGGSSGAASGSTMPKKQ